MRIPLNLYVMGVGLLLIMGGCAPTLHWVQDPLPAPSCLPDRLLHWRDFRAKESKDTRAAETAIRFVVDPRNRIIQALFDPEHSWVKPELIDPQNSLHWRMSEQLLAHERVHFLISCLAVRQANLSLTPDDDVWKMLALTRSVAQRLNLQYDADTNHGTRLDQQEAWEREVMAQLVELVPPLQIHQ